MYAPNAVHAVNAIQSSAQLSSFIQAVAMHNYQNKMLPYCSGFHYFSLAVQSYPQIFPPTLPSQFRHSQLQPPVPPSIPPAFGSNVPPAFPPLGKFNLLGAGLIRMPPAP